MIDAAPANRLLWKELRQLMPLGATLVVLAVIMHVLGLMGQPGGMTYDYHALILYCLPGLFAVGAGAVLVGLEKEQRTLDWLRALPIRPSELLRVKFLASLVGLVACWLVSYLLYLVTDLLRGDPAVSVSPAFFVFPSVHAEGWMLQSLFVMCVGLWLAWWLPSTFLSLLVLLFVSLLPAAAATLVSVLFLTSTGDAATLLLAYVVFLMAAVVLGLRAGRKYLQAVDTASPVRLPAPASVWQSLPWAMRNGWLPTPTAALTWQSVRQQWPVLLATGAAAILARLSWVVGAGGFTGQLAAVTALMLFLLVSWCGVAAFQPDRTNQRMQFLAQHPVSATKVWCTRHVGFVTLLTSLVTINVVLGLTAQLLTATRQPVTTITLILVGVPVTALVAYAVAQWLGQVVPSLVLAAVISPVVVGMAFSYLEFCLTMLGCPIWLLAVCVSLPFVATWRLMPRWLDGRTDAVFWSGHAAATVLFVLLPACPLGICWLTEPTMPAEIRRQLIVEAYHSPRWTGVAPKSLSLQFPPEEEHSAMELDASLGDLTPPENKGDQEAELVNPAQRLAWRYQAAYFDLQRQLDTPAAPCALTPQVGDFLILSANLARGRASNATSGGPSADKASSDDATRYNQFIHMATQIVQRLRMSWRLVEQDQADRLEIWLTSELLDPAGRALLTAEQFDCTAKVLADQHGRRLARRRAIALSWRDYQQSDEGDLSLGGYYNLLTTTPDELPILKQQWQRNRRLQRVVCELWLWTNSQDPNAGEACRERLAKLLRMPPETYGVGNLNQAWRVDEARSWALAFASDIALPGAQWFAGWEDQARTLNKGEQP